MFASNLAESAKSIGGVVFSILHKAVGDIFMFGGIAAVIWGVHLLSVPWAYIIGGAIFVLIGIYGSPVGE